MQLLLLEPFLQQVAFLLLDEALLLQVAFGVQATIIIVNNVAKAKKNPLFMFFISKPLKGNFVFLILKSINTSFFCLLIIIIKDKFDFV